MQMSILKYRSQAISVQTAAYKNNWLNAMKNFFNKERTGIQAST